MTNYNFGAPPKKKAAPPEPRPFRVVVVPYRRENFAVRYCVLERRTAPFHQFASAELIGDEPPEDVAARLVREQLRVKDAAITRLTVRHIMIPDEYDGLQRIVAENQPRSITEHTFGAEIRDDDFMPSPEFESFQWLEFNEALNRVRSRTPLYDLNSRL